MHVGRPPSLGLAVLLACLLLVPPTHTIAGGLPTPDDAVREYLAGVAAADASRILEVSAIDEMVEGYRFVDAVDRFRAFMPLTMLAPADHPLYVAVDRAQRTDEILGQVLALSYSLLSGQTIDGSPIAPADGAWAEEFTALVDPSRLAGIEVRDVRFPGEQYEDSEAYITAAAANAATYGADELTERVVLFELEGVTYALGFTLLRYGDRWMVSSQSSPLSGLPVVGAAQPMSVEAYEALTVGGD